MNDVQQALTDAVTASLASLAPVAEPVSRKGLTTPQVPAPSQKVAESEPTEEVEEEFEETPTEEEGESEEQEGEGEGDATLPEGYVAVPTVSDKLATEFVLRDAEGEVEVPDLIVEYKANGKVRKDRLDKVVKLAQFGVYNEERERRAQEAEQVLSQAQQEREQLLSQIQEYNRELERLMTDDDYFLSMREDFAQQNSPEQRAARAEQEVKDLRVRTEMQNISRRGEEFYAAEVVPALKLINQSLPTVSPEEMEERMAYAMSLHAETAPNGQRYLPPSQFGKLRDYLVKDLVIWAQMQHAARSEATPEETPSQTKLARAQAEAQKAKRALGQATRPMGRAGNGQFQSKKPKLINNVDDAMQSATDEILSSLGR